MDIADNIKEFAEDTYGCSCDTVVGGEDAISLYDSSLNKFATFTKEPNPEDLSWYISLSLDMED